MVDRGLRVLLILDGCIDVERGGRGIFFRCLFLEIRVRSNLNVFCMYDIV